jgi:hypothetical protein
MSGRARRIAAGAAVDVRRSQGRQDWACRNQAGRDDHPAHRDGWDHYCRQGGQDGRPDHRADWSPHYRQDGRGDCRTDARSGWVVPATLPAAAAKDLPPKREDDVSFHPPTSVPRFRSGQSTPAGIFFPPEQTVNRRGCMRNRLIQIFAAAGAIAGWSALLLQLTLTLTLTLMRAQDSTVLDGLWRYFGYFTVVANIFAAFVLTCAALQQNWRRGEFAAVTAMILVGIVYSLLLRETWDPRGWQKVADVALHDAMPVIVALFWLLRPHGNLNGRDIAATVVLPLGYCAYAMARGAFDNWYPYPFLDVTALGAGAVAINCIGLGLAFLVMAFLLSRLDRKLA